jgi:hypothetical protein
MKAVINGLRYDTETAVEIGGSSGGGFSRRDFGYWSATLYTTPRKRWFLAGEGGPMSMFAKAHGDGSRSGGAGIIPMTPEEAREWAERHLPTETVEDA